MCAVHLKDFCEEVCPPLLLECHHVAPGQARAGAPAANTIVCLQVLIFDIIIVTFDMPTEKYLMRISPS